MKRNIILRYSCNYYSFFGGRENEESIISNRYAKRMCWRKTCHIF